MKDFKVRDKRNKGWFYLDNEYLNGFGSILGADAIAVYVSLCRHSNDEQRCFPSQETIAREINRSERRVREVIKQLEENKIIKIIKERSDGGTWLNNTYYLLDKTEWKYPKAHSSYGSPEANDDTTRGTSRHDQRHVVPINNTNKNNTNKKNTNTAIKIAGDNINNLINLFKPINPSYDRFFSNKTERLALERLLKKTDYDNLCNVISKLKETNGIRYAPTITSPLELERKLASLIAFIRKQNNNSKIIEI
jgi:hypothetical protein